MIIILAAISWSVILGKAWKIILAILFFGIIVMIHEFGHFITAKLCKVKVNEFSIGMGPALFKKKKGETLYALRLFPIGGYVSMEGEDEESEDERAFNRKPVWQRIIIVVAGATMNLILGLIIVAVMLSHTELLGTNVIHSFSENAVSEQNGLRVGDKFLKIDGHRLYSEMDLTFLLSRSEDGKYDLVVERDGEKVRLDGVQFETHEVDGVNIITYDGSDRYLLMYCAKVPSGTGADTLKFTLIRKPAVTHYVSTDNVNVPDLLEASLIYQIAGMAMTAFREDVAASLFAISKEYLENDHHPS